MNIERWCRAAILALLLAATPWTMAAAAETDPISKLAWLEGHWEGDRGETHNEEIWSSPRGGALVGMHKDTRGGKMVGFEFLRIVARGDSVFYMAMPGGAPPTLFHMIELGERRVVFENPSHDFPQRVLYWLDDTRQLHARIEGDMGGKARSMEWIWQRQPAPVARD
jgi:hypothetical protein